MKIYNTLTKQKEVFKPLRYPEVKIYQCGPTVYNYAHIGNLKTSVIEDLVARSLDFLGYQTNIVMNITDIDDKTIRDSQASKEKLLDFTRRYTEIFLSDLEKLGVRKPDTITPISQIIPEMIRMIQTLLNRGYAYISDDESVYYSVSKFKKYGKLAHIDMSGLTNSVRIDNDEYDKDTVADFVLWKAHRESDGENSWDATYLVENKEIVIRGRPGWHIECSACAMKHFGPQIDLHMGGEDLIFPHHQNEVAQTEACTGKTFSKYWLHSGHLLVDGKKMSKSLGNFYTLKDIEERYVGEENIFRAIRLSFLNGKYRDQINFSFEKLDQNLKTLANIYNGIQKLIAFTPSESGVRNEFREALQVFMSEYIEALEDDFSFSEALAIFFRFHSFAGDELKSGELSYEEQQSLIDIYKSFDQVFQIIPNETYVKQQEELIPDEIQKLIGERSEAKKQKDFAKADSIREEVEKLGYRIVDEVTGSRGEKI